MTNSNEPLVRKTISLPESVWKEVSTYRFNRRFPTETAAVSDVVSRGLKANSVLSAIADIATGRRKEKGKFSQAAARTFGDAPSAQDLLENDVRNWVLNQGLSITEAKIQTKTRQVLEAAERLAGGQAAGGQAAILDIAAGGLIEWAMNL